MKVNVAKSDIHRINDAQRLYVILPNFDLEVARDRKWGMHVKFSSKEGCVHGVHIGISSVKGRLVYVVRARDAYSDLISFLDNVGDEPVMVELMHVLN